MLLPEELLLQILTVHIKRSWLPIYHKNYYDGLIFLFANLAFFAGLNEAVKILAHLLDFVMAYTYSRYSEEDSFPFVQSLL